MYLSQTITDKEAMMRPGFTEAEVQKAACVEMWAAKITAVEDYREGRLINQDGRTIGTRRIRIES